MTTTPPYQVTNPATGAVVETFPFATDAEIEAALASAAAAYPALRDRSLDERVAIVKKVAALFVERADELGAIILEEMGKKLSGGIGEAQFCGDIFGYYADNGPALL